MEKKIKKSTNKLEVTLTEDEMVSVLDISTDYREVLNDFGELYLRKLQLDEETKRINEAESDYKETYMSIQRRETDTANRLTKKYGEGHVDTIRGVYIKAKKSI